MTRRSAPLPRDEQTLPNLKFEKQWRARFLFHRKRYSSRLKPLPRSWSGWFGHLVAQGKRHKHVTIDLG